MIYKEKILPIKNWIIAHFTLSQTKGNLQHQSKNVFNIPIQRRSDIKHILPIHIALSANNSCKINSDIINALGGPNNIETYHEIPNSRRIRLTLVNPSLIDNELLEELDVRMFIRIGKRIVHIIP